MSPDPTRSVPPDPEQTRSAAPTPPDGAAADFDPSATPPHVAAFADHLGALAGSAGTAPADAPGPVVLPRVPGYEVLGVLGRGGMGVVYHAREVALNRPVALKMVLAGPYADPATRARFLLEAESVAAVRHPQIVGVYAFGEHAGHPYLAMEYLPGGTLADRVRATGPLPPAEAAALAATLADAVAAAHAAGVIHRDLKPANVLLTADGRPKVTDFGLAKVGRSDMTATGAVLGTPSYMAPEQAAGKTREVGTAADVYGLGAILYDLLTGRPPFKGDSQAATIQLVLTADPARPRTLNAAVPRDLETVCLRCLEKDPSRRYATAAAAGDDLRRFLAGEPVEARPVGRAERAWRWCRRNPAVAALLAAVLVVSGAGTSVSAYYAVEAGERAKEAGDNAKRAGDRERDATDERNKALAAQDRTRRLLYASQMNLVSMALNEGRIDQLTRLLDEARPPPGEPDMRGWEWHYLDRLTRPAARSFPIADPPPATPLHANDWLAARLTPDGRWLALPRPRPGGTEFEVWDVAAGRRSAVVGSASRDNPAGFGPPHPAISPDGTHVAAFVPSGKPAPADVSENLAPAGIRVWEVATGRDAGGPSGEYAGAVELVVGPGAAWVTWVEARDAPAEPGAWSGLGQITRCRWDRSTGRVARHVVRRDPADPPGVEMNAFGLSPDGGSLEWHGYRGDGAGRDPNDRETRVDVWDVTTDPPTRRLRTTWLAEAQTAWSPAGRAFCVTAGGRLTTYRAGDGSTTWTAALPQDLGPHRPRDVYPRAVSDDGTRVIADVGLSAGSGHALLVLDRNGPAADAPARATWLYDRDGAVVHPRLAADGKTVVTFGAATVRAWDVSRDPARPYRWAPPPPGRTHAASRDGRQLAEYQVFSPPGSRAGLTDPALTLRDTATGVESGRVAPPAGLLLGPAGYRSSPFAPGGRRLLVRYLPPGDGSAPGREGRSALYDTDGLREVATWEATERDDAEWCGRWLVVLTDAGLTVRDPETGAIVARVTPPPGRAFATPAADPSGDRIAVTVRSPRAPWLPRAARPTPAESEPVGLRVYEAATGREVWSREDVGRAARGSFPGPHEDGVSEPVFTPDGRWVVVRNTTGFRTTRVRVVGALDGTGGYTIEPPVVGAEQEFAGDEVSPRVWFSPDGRHAALADATTVVVCETATGTPQWRLRGHGGTVAWAEFSADGTRLFCAAQSAGNVPGRLVVWDLVTGRELVTVRLPASGMMPTITPRLSRSGEGIFSWLTDGGVWVFDGTPVKE